MAAWPPLPRENDGNLSAPAAHYVTKVAIKLPDFWSEDPDLWFIHAESAFQNAQITQSRTKFDHVVQKLLQNIMVSVHGLILTSSSTSSTPYEDLKAKLVASYTLSRWHRVSKVIHHPALGDHRPTALMDAMLALLPEDEVPGSLLLGRPRISKIPARWQYTQISYGMLIEHKESILS